MLKVLITSYYYSQNTYVKSIVDHLKLHCKVLCDTSSFWTTNMDFNVIHIQWIEELFKWQPITNQDLIKLEERLSFWHKKGAKIVVTRHNNLPHRNHKLDVKLYDLVFRKTEAVIHLGEYSKKEFADNKLHVVIQHPNYLELVNNLEASNIRGKYNIPSSAKLFLSFGVIRNKNEELQIINAFKKVSQKTDYLIITNSLFKKNKPSFITQPFLRLKHNVKAFALNKSRIFPINKRLTQKEINSYFKSANVIISPRINTLNSGVIYMAFSFSKIVIGPNTGNVKELLMFNNNPVFQPLNQESICNALIKAKKQLESDIEVRNYKFAKHNCSSKLIAQEHYNLYKVLIK